MLDTAQDHSIQTKVHAEDRRRVEGVGYRVTSTAKIAMLAARYCLMILGTRCLKAPVIMSVNLAGLTVVLNSLDLFMRWVSVLSVCQFLIHHPMCFCRFLQEQKASQISLAARVEFLEKSLGDSAAKHGQDPCDQCVAVWSLCEIRWVALDSRNCEMHIKGLQTYQGPRSTRLSSHGLSVLFVVDTATISHH